MNKLFTAIVVAAGMSTAFAQDFKIKKGEIIIEKQAVAKIEKDNKGYKISSLDGSVWFTANAINITQTKNVAIKFWLELTGSNGNLREVEYREVPFTFSKEKWHVEALLKSDTGLLSVTGVNAQTVNDFFSTQDRSVSDKWDKIIGEQLAENAKEDQLAKEQNLVLDGRTIKRNDEIVGSFQREQTQQGGSTIRYVYTFFNGNKVKVASLSFYGEENLDKGGLFLKLSNGEKSELNRIEYSFNKINFDDLTKRAIHRLNTLEYLIPAEDNVQRNR